MLFAVEARLGVLLGHSGPSSASIVWRHLCVTDDAEAWLSCGILAAADMRRDKMRCVSPATLVLLQVLLGNKASPLVALLPPYTTFVD